jgi:CubicO group peptidase (beta-lactamase class C family)
MSVKLRLTCVKVSTVLVFMLFFQLAKAQADFSEVANKIEKARKELGGAAVALIYKDGKLVYQKTMGDITPKTQAPVAALSQWLTAALVMTLVDQGKLSLDDKVSKFLPIFSKYAKGYITIRDCLDNFTGIESETIHLSSYQGSKYASLEEEVEVFASKKEIQANPGVEFRYNNTGLNIAGRVVEIVTKRGFEQMMQERITRPLMMRSTNFSSLNAVNPAGGALTSANDYLNFLSMILNKGMFNGKRILSEQAIAEMQTVRTTPSLIKYAPKLAEGFNYGFGAWITATDEKGLATAISCPGLFGSWASIDKCRGYAFVLLTKELVTFDKKDFYLGIKQAIDDQISPACK